MKFNINVLSACDAAGYFNSMSGCVEGGASSQAPGKARLIWTGGLRQGTVEFKNVADRSKNADAYYMSGVLEENQTTAEGYGNYSKALELNPEHLMPKQVGKDLFNGSRHPKARRWLAKFLPKTSNPAALTLKRL